MNVSNSASQLAADTELFRQLPPCIQRQAWELNTPLFRHQALPSVLGYKDETATVMRELDMVRCQWQPGKFCLSTQRTTHWRAELPPVPHPWAGWSC